jgi:hypothetical protein
MSDTVQSLEASLAHLERLQTQVRHNITTLTDKPTDLPSA